MAKHTIKLKKYSDVIEEYVAAGAITPGMLIELNSLGTVQYHSTEDGDALPMFALEDELQGEEIDDAFAALDRVQCWIPYRGDQVYAGLADGESVVIGDFLTSKGDGWLKKHVVTSEGELEYPNAVVAIALEALDLYDSSAESSGPLGYNKRLMVRIV